MADNTTTLRMTPWAWDVLCDEHGWDDGEGTVTWEHGHMDGPDGSERVHVTITTTACQSVDLLDAARHVIHNIQGWTDEDIEVLAHDGTVTA